MILEISLAKGLPGASTIQRDLTDLKSGPLTMSGGLQGQMQGPAPGLGQSQLRRQDGHRMIESSPEEDLGELVDEKLGMSWQCMFAAQKASCFLAASKAVWTEGEGEDSAPLLCSW